MRSTSGFREQVDDARMVRSGHSDRRGRCAAERPSATRADQSAPGDGKSNEGSVPRRRRPSKAARAPDQFAAEAINQFLLLGIGHAAMQDCNCVGFRLIACGSFFCSQLRVSIRSEKITRRSDVSVGCQLNWGLLQVLDQALELAEARGVYRAQGCREFLQGRDFRPFVPADACFCLQQTDSALCGLQCGKRTGEQRLLHPHSLQFLLLACSVLPLLGKRNGQQGPVGSFFLWAGGLLNCSVIRSWKSALTWSRMSFLKRRTTSPLSRKSSGV